jgi:hypothetical protein
MEEVHCLGGGQRLGGVPRRGVALPCGEAVPVGGRRRHRTGVAGRLGRVKGHAPPGPGGSGLCACWTAWRGTGSGPPRREGWGMRQDPSVGVEPTGSTPSLYYNPPGNCRNACKFM